MDNSTGKGSKHVTDCEEVQITREAKISKPPRRTVSFHRHPSDKNFHRNMNKHTRSYSTKSTVGDSLLKRDLRNDLYEEKTEISTHIENHRPEESIIDIVSCSLTKTSPNVSRSQHLNQFQEKIEEKTLPIKECIETDLDAFEAEVVLNVESLYSKSFDNDVEANHSKDVLRRHNTLPIIHTDEKYLNLRPFNLHTNTLQFHSSPHMANDTTPLICRSHQNIPISALSGSDLSGEPGKHQTQTSPSMGATKKNVFFNNTVEEVIIINSGDSPNNSSLTSSISTTSTNSNEVSSNGPEKTVPQVCPSGSSSSGLAAIEEK